MLQTHKEEGHLVGWQRGGGALSGSGSEEGTAEGASATVLSPHLVQFRVGHAGISTAPHSANKQLTSPHTPLHHTTPHHHTPHHTTPHHMPHCTTHRTTPHTTHPPLTTLHHTTPHTTHPPHTLLHHTTLHHTPHTHHSPHYTTHHTTQYHTTPHRTT